MAVRSHRGMHLLADRGGVHTELCARKRAVRIHKPAKDSLPRTIFAQTGPDQHVSPTIRTISADGGCKLISVSEIVDPPHRSANAGIGKNPRGNIPTVGWFRQRLLTPGDGKTAIGCRRHAGVGTDIDAG